MGARLNIFQSRIPRGLQSFVCGKEVAECKIILHPQGCVDNFGKIGMGSSNLDMTAVLHFRADLAHVKIEYSRRTQILTGAVQETDYFPTSLAINRIYEFHFRSGMSLSLYRDSSQGGFLRKHPLIDRNSGFACY